MTNMQKSELVIARILSLLMEWGIQQTEMTFEELNLGEEFAPFFFPCINWLADEGIIRFQQTHQFMSGPADGLVNLPVLTSFGMNALNKGILIGDEREDLSAVVKKVSEGGKSYSGLGDFIGGLLGGFTKSMGS